MSLTAALHHHPVPWRYFCIQRFIKAEVQAVARGQRNKQDESPGAGSRPDEIDESIVSKLGQELQNNVRIYCTKPQALNELCKKPRHIIVLRCWVCWLDLHSHPFTLAPSLLQGWFSRSSLENSDLRNLSQASCAWLTVWSLTGESPVCDSVFMSYTWLRDWLFRFWGQISMKVA